MFLYDIYVSGRGYSNRLIVGKYALYEDIDGEYLYRCWEIETLGM